MRVRLGYSNLYIHPAAECLEQTTYGTFSDFQSALDFLTQFKTHSLVIFDLRRVLQDDAYGDWNLRTESEVWQEVARRLYLGELRVTEHGFSIVTGAAGTVEAEPMDAPPPARPPPRPPAADEPTFPANHSAVAQAAALQAAAQSGAPFCET